MNIIENERNMKLSDEQIARVAGGLDAGLDPHKGGAGGGGGGAGIGPGSGGGGGGAGGGSGAAISDGNEDISGPGEGNNGSNGRPGI